MKKLLGKKLNKNGFTLAELLIVVAIIAVLIAIAMPLLFGALDDAKQAKENANKRASKSIVLNELLENPQKYRYCQDGTGTGAAGTLATADSWVVYAFISEDGTIEVADIVPNSYELVKADPLLGGFTKEQYIEAMKEQDYYEKYTEEAFETDKRSAGKGIDRSGWSKYLNDTWYEYIFYIFDTELTIGTGSSGE